MVRKSFVIAVAALLIAGAAWAGDTAVFTDLGFSPDGKTYMFGQYGVESGSLKPWADVFVVDVPSNNYVSGGKISYTHSGAVVAGQDGSGALFKLIADNAALAKRYGIDYLRQGQPLYVSLDSPAAAPASVEFRDFEAASSFKATMSTMNDAAGSSFYITLERRRNDGSSKSYVVGNPKIKRAGVVGYRIAKVAVAPHDGSVIFVIEMKKQNAGGGIDIRYMVEALKL
jgi:predicted secreted protein